MSRHLLLTGATGLIGGYLLRDLLESGANVAVLARPRGNRSAEERVEAVVSYWERQLGIHLPRPKCLIGDIAVEGLGLSSEDRQWVARHCDRLLHNAASVTFDGADRNGEPWRSNLGGAHHLLNLAEWAKIREMHWMSTAYVCGDRETVVREDELNCGQIFRNNYERSKFEAELLVRDASFLDSLTVYRPSIVGGDSHTGFTSSYHNIYLFLQFTWIVSHSAEHDADGHWRFPVRLTFEANGELNLVPVDWVSAAVTHLVHSPKSHGNTYHLSHPRPMTCGQMEAALAQYFNYEGVEFVGPDGIPPGDQTDLERWFYMSLAAHDSYWLCHPRFDRTNAARALEEIPCPAVDVDYLLRLFEFAVRNRFGKPARSRGAAVASVG